MNVTDSLELYNNFKRCFRELHTWIQDTIWPRGVFEILKVIDVVQNHEGIEGKTWCFFAFSTSSHVYSFTAAKPYRDELEGYISGDVSPRLPLNGEKASGSNDLSGGGIYSEETWVNLLRGVVKYEVVPFPQF